MKISGATIFTCAVSLLAMGMWLYWHWKFDFKPKRDKQRVLGAGDDKLLRNLADTLDVVHDLFGNTVSLRTFYSNDGRGVGIACPKCDKVNRLVKGFRGAKCGKCKRPLTMRSVGGEKEVSIN